MHLDIQSFEDLSNYDLYSILKLREQVFMFEQKSTDPELDDWDLRATHLFYKEEGSGDVVAAVRVFAAGVKDPDAAMIGRFLVAKELRGKGLGRKLFQAAVDHLTTQSPGAPIVMSAQAYLEDYYHSFGFETISDLYDEAGIPHIKMKRP